MTRNEFYKEISERTGIPKKTVEEVIVSEENLIYEIMATCDSFKYIWGTISGIEKPPKRIAGMYTELEPIKANHGWSNWKFGYPHVKWAKASKVCEIHSAEEYFAQDSKRYTSEARGFRQGAGLPEIPEFEGLPEEKILEICQKADDIEWNSLTKVEQKHKARDRKFNDQKKIAMVEYWNKIGYVPQGSIYEERLGDKNYLGEQRDTVDFYIEKYINTVEALDERYDSILKCIDLAEYKNLIDKHPELYEMKESLGKLMDEKGIKKLPHKVKDYEHREFKLKMNGEVNPWNIEFTRTRSPKARQETAEKQREEMINEVKELSSNK